MLGTDIYCCIYFGTEVILPLVSSVVRCCRVEDTDTVMVH